MYLVMNKDKWDELPADIQAVFTEVSEKYVEYWANVAAGYDYDGIKFLLEQPGREVIDLAEDEAARWATAVRPLIDDKLTALSGAGFTDDYEGYINERISYWAANSPTEEECSAWMAENVKAPSAQ
jgi:hypothetical protein